MLLEVMGRRAGWIATYAGMANGADAILIPEIPMNESRIEVLCDMLKERNRRGIGFSIVVVAEGTELEGKIIVKAGIDISEVSKSERIYGLGGVGNVLGEIIEKKTGLETRVSSLDYIQRGGTPVAYDRNLATAFGVKAVKLITEKRYGEMAALKGNRITSVPLEKVADGTKTVNLNIYKIAEIFFG
jgi:6-phosphofructokinase 1